MQRQTHRRRREQVEGAVAVEVGELRADGRNDRSAGPGDLPGEGSVSRSWHVAAQPAVAEKEIGRAVSVHVGEHDLDAGRADGR
jgi:hypothetical protein